MDTHSNILPFFSSPYEVLTNENGNSPWNVMSGFPFGNFQQYKTYTLTLLTKIQLVLSLLNYLALRPWCDKIFILIYWVTTFLHSQFFVNFSLHFQSAHRQENRIYCSTFSAVCWHYEQIVRKWWQVLPTVLWTPKQGC